MQMQLASRDPDDSGRSSGSSDGSPGAPAGARDVDFDALLAHFQVSTLFQIQEMRSGASTCSFFSCFNVFIFPITHTFSGCARQASGSKEGSKKGAAWKTHATTAIVWIPIQTGKIPENLHGAPHRCLLSPFRWLHPVWKQLWILSQCLNVLEGL